MISIFDIGIILILMVVTYFGLRITSWRQITISIGALAGFLAAVVLYGQLAFLAEDSGVRTLLLGLLSAASGFLFCDVVLNLGARLKHYMPQPKVKSRLLWQRIANTAVGAAVCLIILWLSSVMLSGSQIPFVQRQIDGSAIIALFNRTFEAPALFRRVAHLIQPFSSPQVFAGSDPLFASNSMVVTKEFMNLDEATAKVTPSVVKVRAWGCGSASTGTGFLLTKSLIATNAHVVAGANRTSIEDQKGTYSVQTVWFDPELDIAVLKTTGELSAEPLGLRANIASPGSVGSMLGYPEGGALSINDTVILQTINAAGYDIYGKAKVTRQIYAFRGGVVPGDSGGPLIDASGKVAGLIFGSSTSEDRTGYALTTDYLAQALAAAKTMTTPTGNGSCAT